MQAITLREHGGPEKLILEEVPDPTPGPFEVLIRVEAVALNHLDLWVRKGLPGLRLKYPHILGSDISGVVAGLGPGVSDVPIGTPVVLQPGVACGRCRECLSGHDNLCRSYGILGENVAGGYAQYIVVPWVNLLPRPERLDPVQAAAYPLTMLTAWQMLVTKARVQPGETVLVLAAGSGVGSAGVQIAKLFGARVIATSTSAEKLTRAVELGADEVVNTTTHDLVDAVKALTDRSGADVVFEHVGQATWDKSILACKRGGRIVTCGATSGYDARTDLRHVFFRQISILGSTMGTKADLWEVTQHIACGRLRPVVDRVLRLEEARSAHEILESRAQFGKLVLRVA